jgi:hypothetical protein
MCILVTACIFLSTLAVGQTVAENGAPNPSVPLTVLSGAPLRLYLTKRVPKRLGALVEGKTIEPVFAFDREVLTITESHLH